MTNKPLLKMSDIDKSFPGVIALRGVNFTLQRGEIHALLGENGAGKSTLIKVLTGVYQADKGIIELSGGPICAESPQHAQKLGISTVYQEVNLCDNLTVAENIFIGRQPMIRGCIDWKSIYSRSRVLLQGLSLNIDVTKTLDNYSVAVKQMVAIARALDISAKVLILDEPTSSLDKAECQKLFEVMRKLCSEGMGIIFITHFLDQVYDVADRITILRNGKLVGSFETAKLTKIELIGKMIGKDYEILDTVSRSGATACEGENFLTTDALGCSGSIEPFSLKVNKNEVMGLAGLLGSGRTETARVIFGVDKPDSGKLYVRGSECHFKSPIDAIKMGIAYCPEDRKTDGILPELSIKENIVLALQTKRGIFNFIDDKSQKELADKYIKLLDIKTPNSEQSIKNLSGGNQQKVILARWLATEPDLLILDEPTRGIDIGTKAEIQKLVIELAADGMAIVFISSEMDEMLRCCSRMAVYSEKQKLGELSEDQMNEKSIMDMIAGGGAQ